MASSETSQVAVAEPVKSAPPLPAATEAKPPPSAVESEKTAAVQPQAPEAPPPETKALGGAGASKAVDHFPVINVVLRLLLFISVLIAVVVMATSKQTEVVQIPIPPFLVALSAEFNYAPAFVYFITALSITGLYSIITTILSFYALIKPTSSSKLLAHFVIFDVLLLGVVAAATGSAGAVAYIGYKGNSHARWGKICDTYGSYCRHVAASLVFSLIGSVVLVLLILLSIHSISKKIPK